MTTNLVDSNIFIHAKHLHYGFDFFDGQAANLRSQKSSSDIMNGYSSPGTPKLGAATGLIARAT